MPTVTTQTLNFPHEFRPVPRFLIDVPAEWTVMEYPGALFAVSSVDPEQPWMNIVVSHERILVGTHEDVLIQRFVEVNAKHPDVVVEPEKGFRFDEIEFIGRDMTYTDPDLGVVVNRFDVSTTAPNPIGLMVDDLFTISFLSPDEATKQYADLALDVLTSFRFA